MDAIHDAGAAGTSYVDEDIHGDIAAWRAWEVRDRARIVSSIRADALDLGHDPDAFVQSLLSAAEKTVEDVHGEWHRVHYMASWPIHASVPDAIRLIAARHRVPTAMVSAGDALTWLKTEQDRYLDELGNEPPPQDT